MVTAAVFFNSGEAYLARDFLARAGIESFIFDEYMGTIYPSIAVGGIKLKVRAGDLDQARVVLESLTAAVEKKSFKRDPGRSIE